MGPHPSSLSRFDRVRSTGPAGDVRVPSLSSVAHRGIRRAPLALPSVLVVAIPTTAKYVYFVPSRLSEVVKLSRDLSFAPSLNKSTSFRQSVRHAPQLPPRHEHREGTEVSSRCQRSMALVARMYSLCSSRERLLHESPSCSVIAAPGTYPLPQQNNLLTFQIVI